MLIHDHLEAAGQGADEAGTLFRPLGNIRTGRFDGAITPDGACELVRAYARQTGAEVGALDHEAGIAKVQEWLGDANIATIRIYDHRRTRPEDSPTFKVA